MPKKKTKSFVFLLYALGAFAIVATEAALGLESYNVSG